MTVSSHDVRERAAKAAFDHLGPNPSDYTRLQVSCARNHHVAAVYDTDLGAVYRAVTHAGSHGKRDRIDTGHRGHHTGRTWFDILNPAEDHVDDGMPAGCECGPYTLSRDLLIQHIAEGERRIVLD
jgi:hypothetical protein